MVRALPRARRCPRRGRPGMPPRRAAPGPPARAPPPGPRPSAPRTRPPTPGGRNAPGRACVTAPHRPSTSRILLAVTRPGSLSAASRCSSRRRARRRSGCRRSAPWSSSTTPRRSGASSRSPASQTGMPRSVMAKAPACGAATPSSGKGAFRSPVATSAVAIWTLHAAGVAVHVAVAQQDPRAVDADHVQRAAVADVALLLAEDDVAPRREITAAEDDRAGVATQGEEHPLGLQQRREARAAGARHPPQVEEAVIARQVAPAQRPAVLEAEVHRRIAIEHARRAAGPRERDLASAGVARRQPREVAATGEHDAEVLGATHPPHDPPQRRHAPPDPRDADHDPVAVRLDPGHAMARGRRLSHPPIPQHEPRARPRRPARAVRPPAPVSPTRPAVADNRPCRYDGRQPPKLRPRANARPCGRVA